MDKPEDKLEDKFEDMQDGKSDVEPEELDEKTLDNEIATAPAPAKAGVRLPIVAVLLVVAVIVTLCATFAITSSKVVGTGGAAVSEDKLNNVVASYTYKGKSYDVTARDIWSTQYSLETIKNEDGTYPAPTAEAVLAYVRQAILLNNADEEGIEVTDEEALDYANKTIGSRDIAAIAKKYQLSEDQAMTVVKNSAKIEKLYQSYVGEGATMPETPAEPEQGSEDTPSQEYADYIVDLLGDNWDSENNTWANEDNEFYQVLGADFKPENASYNTAISAYYVAYMAYSNQAGDSKAEWTNHLNELYKDVELTMVGVFAGTN